MYTGLGVQSSLPPYDRAAPSLSGVFRRPPIPSPAHAPLSAHPTASAMPASQDSNLLEPTSQTEHAMTNNRAAVPELDGPARSGSPPPPSSSHPLGPLTAKEISQSAGLIRRCWPDTVDCHFKVVTLLEPAKADLAPYLAAERAGLVAEAIDRRAFVVYYLRGTVSRAPPSPPPRSPSLP